MPSQMALVLLIGGLFLSGADAWAQESNAEPPAAASAPVDAETAARRLQTLEENIAAAEKARQAARQRIEDAEQTLADLDRQFEIQLERGAADELAELRTRIEETQQRLRAARDESRRYSDLIEQRQAERAMLLANQVRALREGRERVSWRQRFSSERLVAWLLDHGVKLLLIVAAAAVLLWIERIVAARVLRFLIRTGGRGSKAELENRAATLVSVFRNTMIVAIYVAAVLMVLQEIGISIGPLLAGAGVIGLAIAFGAQSLVKDFFYGFMILLENQYGVNDVVKIGNTAGLVERITLRITVLRDEEGTAHFIPHGTINTVSNMTHLWSRAVFAISVAYKEDIEHVMDVLMDLARELRQDPKFAPMILEDPQMAGVDALGESAVVIKFTVKTQPLKQWEVKREMLRRIKRRFDQEGIEIPFPHRTLYVRDQREERPAEEQSEKWEA